MRQAESRHPDEPGDVDRPDGRLVLLARLVERGPAHGETGVVDEDVEAADALDGLCDEAFAAHGVGDVQRERDLGLQPIDAARAAGHVHARSRERSRSRAADARRRAGHDRPLAGQVEGRHGP